MRLTRETFRWGTQYRFGEYRIIHRRLGGFWSVCMKDEGEVFNAEYLSEVREWLAGQSPGKGPSND